MNTEITTLNVDDTSAGERLDRFLADSLPEMTRGRLQQLVREGAVTSGGMVVTEVARRVKPCETFSLTLPELRPAIPAAEDVVLDVLFEDEHLLVLHKPAGMVVHPAPGHSGGTLVNALLAHCSGSLSGIGGVARPGIVHRLDKDVSGVMVVAKHDRAHVGLAGQFTVHSVDRAYEAVVYGLPPEMTGTVDKPLGRSPTDRMKMAVVRHGGKRAVTRWRVVEAAGTRAARMRVELETGRTHQIRVHLSDLGHPIVGDHVYGPRRLPQLCPAAKAMVEQFKRIALHARILGFDHPITGERLSFDRAAPIMFGGLLQALGEQP